MKTAYCFPPQFPADKELTYPVDFAEGCHQAFLPGDRQDLINRADSTRDEFLANEEMWLARPYKGTRYRYTAEEMEKHWRCIVAQKHTIQARWETPHMRSVANKRRAEGGRTVDRPIVRGPFYPTMNFIAVNILSKGRAA